MTMRSRTPRKPTSGSPRPGGRVRIIGGRWKRRVLDVVDVPGLRPTPDRVRETLFNWLTHACGGGLEGHSALDLFAGTGALGLEAASRGADPVVLVERDPRAVRQLRQARIDLDAPGSVEILSGDAFQLGLEMRQDARRFDIVFLDPPFGEQRLDVAVPLAAGLCRPDGWIYVEAETPLAEAGLEALGVEPFRSDRAGDVFYHLLRRNKKNS